MDETLNRPLFRNKARHYQQIQTGNINKKFAGGPIITAALNYGPKLYRAGQMGLQTFRQAQAARPVTGRFSQAGQRLGEIVAPLDKPIANVGLGGLGMFEGYEDISQGVEDRNVGQIVSGIGQGVGGARFGIRGLTQAGYPRATSLTKTLDESKLGKLTDPLSLSGIPFYGSTIAAGFLPNEKKDLRETINREIERLENARKQKLSPVEKQQVESIITEDLKPKQPQQPQTSLEKAFGNISNVDIIAGVRPVDSLSAFSNTATNIVDQSNNAKSLPPGGLSTGEIISTLENDEKKRKQGEILKKQASTSDEKGASGFKKFLEAYDKETGGSSEISDLLMYKLATGLLTGTTTKTGFAGFADVLGKAGGDVLDSAILLASKERDRKASLFEAYTKATKANEGRSSVGTERYTIQIPDETASFGKRNITIARFKDGTDAKAIESDEIDPITGKPTIAYVPLEFNPNAIELPKPSAKDFDERRAALNSIAGSYRMASRVAKADPGTVGAAGSIKLFKEKILGSVADVLDNEITPAVYNKDSDLYVNKEILGKGVKKADGTFISSEEAIAAKEKLIKQIVDKQGGGSIFGRPTPNELEKLIRNARYEVNFAYAYANSLKAEDRLTEKNLEDAKKVSAIFGLKSSKSIIEQFKQLADDADDKFKLEANRYLDIGGSNAYFDQNFEDIPFTQKEKIRRGGIQKRQEIQQNLMRGVETLPDKYK